MITPGPDEPAPGARPRSTAALLVDAVRAASAHYGDLLRLARIEIRGNLRALTGLVLLFGTAVLLITGSLVLFLLAVRDALAVLIGSEAIAGVIVAAPFLAGTAWLGTAGLRRMRHP